MVDFTPSTPDALPGMTLEEALSIHPDALVLEAYESHYNKVFSQILTSLQGISDRVEGSDLGVAYIRLDGLEHLYGGEARLVNVLLNAVPQDLTPRASVAEAKFPAFVAATVSDPSRATRGTTRCSFVPRTPPYQPAPNFLRPEGRPTQVWATHPRECGEHDRDIHDRPVRI